MANATSGPRATDPSTKTAVPAIDRLSRYLEKLQHAGFYGKVIVSFQHGKVCDVRIEETKKLEEL